MWTKVLIALGNTLIRLVLLPLISEWRIKKKVDKIKEKLDVKTKELEDAKTKKDSLDKFNKLP